MRPHIARRLHALLLIIGLALFAVPAFAQEESEDFRPTLQIPIPGLTFTGVQVREASGEQGISGYVDIPWLAQYVLGVYRYGVAIAGVVAGVTMVIGGWQYMTGNASAGKERIKNSLIGIVLVFGSYVILNTINPDLVDLKPLQLRVPEKQLYAVPEGTMRQITGKSTPSSKEMINKAMAAADALKLPGLACFVKGSMEHESGGKQNAIGHDENVKRTFFPVGSRQKFLQSGVKYSLATFEPIDCRDRNCQGEGPTNDDVVDPSKPDLGLDWRFSHGIGAGQSTIFPTDRGGKPCPGREAEGNGFRRGGKCYTARDLLDPDKSIEAMVAHYADCWKRANGDPAAGYVCYGGNIEPTNPVILKRVQDFDECQRG